MTKKNGKPAKKARAIPDLVVRGAAHPKGGSKIMANAHEMKKSLIANFPR